MSKKQKNLIGFISAVIIILYLVFPYQTILASSTHLTSLSFQSESKDPSLRVEDRVDSKQRPKNYSQKQSLALSKESISTQELGNLLNQERSVRNLNVLNWNAKLYKAAKNKTDHMIKYNYFEHYAPDGTSPWSFILNSKYNYKLAGENLAMDFSTTKSVHDAWMASPTHKENMLNPEYKDYAIYAKQGQINGQNTIVIVEMFASKDNPVLSKTNQFIASILNYILGNTQKFD